MSVLNLVFLLFPFFGLQPEHKVQNSDYQQFLEHLYTGNIPSITVADLQQAEGEPLYLLDSREPQEYRVSHIKYARQVGNIWFDMRDVYDIPKDGMIVVYCTIGDRSQRIAEKLIKAGYTQVYFLYGGMIEWINQGNPVYTETEIQTPQIYLNKKEWSPWLEKGKPIF